MKVFEIQGSFGLDHLKLAERPEPAPGPGQVLLELRAVALNYRDLLMVRGLYNPKQPLPLVPCSDGVGVVRAVGPGVDRVAVGERVATLFCQRWLGGEPGYERVRSTLGGPLDGTLAEALRVLDQDGVVRVPEHLSDAEAATLPCAALTAWSALVTQGGLRPGEVVLVQGTGGVSIFALQLARLAGARVIVTSSRDDKLERAEVGAWAVVNYVATPGWGKAARRLTGGRGVDHVIEVGGAGTLAESLEAVRIGGTISLIGVLAGGASELSIIPIFMKGVRVQGILVGSRDGFEAMCRAIAQHELRPVVDRVFPFAETREAFAYLASGRHFGKVAIDLGAAAP